MAFSVSVRPAALAEMNVTPLVDVMLVLLIIFMVTAPILSRPLDLALPQKGPAPIEAPNILDLDIAADGSLQLDQRGIAGSELAQRFEDAVQSDPRTVLTVSASPEADYQEVVSALSQARLAGIRQISWRGE